MDKTKTEIFENSRWVEIDENELNQRKDFFSCLVHKIKDFYFPFVDETWSLGYRYHRLDGPAFIRYGGTDEIVISEWHVNGVYLNPLVSVRQSVDLIFEYAKTRQRCLKEIKWLCRHNGWLTEYQLSLLDTIS